jgi:NAD(P)-dependent dehydrogenase (short-subunit alcohol dehydrogenase family)
MIISIGNTHGQYKVDISNCNQIKDMFEQIGHFDALIATTGKVQFGLLQEFDTEKWYIGINNKLMGQVNLVTNGLKYIKEGGSFTLTSGLLNHDPIKYGSSAAMINGALEGFVIGASIEMPKGVRINLVSPTVIKESMDKYSEYFQGYIPVSASTAAQAYVKSVEGCQTGQIYRVGW